MWLKEWLFKKNITVVDFAKTLGISREMLSSVISGRIRGSAKIAKSIEVHTKGAITMEDVLLGDKKTRHLR